MRPEVSIRRPAESGGTSRFACALERVRGSADMLLDHLGCGLTWRLVRRARGRVP